MFNARTMGTMTVIPFKLTLLENNVFSIYKFFKHGNSKDGQLVITVYLHIVYSLHAYPHCLSIVVYSSPTICVPHILIKLYYGVRLFFIVVYCVNLRVALVKLRN